VIISVIFHKKSWQYDSTTCDFCIIWRKNPSQLTSCRIIRDALYSIAFF